MTLGSLFDGAGTMPLAGVLCGIEPVWASEIAKFPVKVTGKRFPGMKHLGDITKIRGGAIEPVDVIAFGSPCQGLSVAGKRKGLKDERSSLFGEAIRIIQEMREATNGKYPTFAVWENVPGAFSSHRGEDFRAVLEALCAVKKRDAVIPRPAGGKWADAGSIVADGYSVAWRVLDAQFWGVPQRRRRIYAVADFGGERAGKILFEREGLQRRFAEICQAWKGFAQAAADGVTGARACYDARGNGDGAVCPTITGDHENRITDYTALVVYCKGTRPHNKDDGQVWKESKTANCLNGFDSGEDRANELVVIGADMYNGDLTGDKSMTITANKADYHHVPTVLCMATQQGGAEIAENLCPTITAAAGKSGNNQPVIAFEQKKYDEYRETDVGATIKEKGGACAGGSETLVAGFSYKNSPGAGSVGYQEDVCPTQRAGVEQAVLVFKRESRKLYVRRLTPTECARLQGFPSWWCKDVPHKDSVEYEMWGNGMALPNALYVMEGIARYAKQ